MRQAKKIIVVEDNKADEELLRLTFNEFDLKEEVVYLGNGEELLKYLDTLSLNSVALILLDLNMPKLRGEGILSLFQKDVELRKIPVIMFTSSSNMTDINNCYELGANAYVSKPMDITEYHNTIKAIIDFWIKVNTLPFFKGDTKTV